MTIDPSTNALYLAIGGSVPSIAVIQSFVFEYQKPIPTCEAFNVSATLSVQDGIVYGVCGGKTNSL
jgi:hypothetical protein